MFWSIRRPAQAGKLAYYRIVDEGVFSLCEAVCGSLQRQVESLRELVGDASA
jgi:hypothetical protein